jgi:hypothetical protein
MDFYLFTFVENNSIQAYAITGIEKSPMRKNNMNKMEIPEAASVGADETKIGFVLETACDFAIEQGLTGLSFISSDQHPFIPMLNHLGFEESPRGMHVMAKR